MARDEWKRGLPPGKYYDGMVDDFEVTFAILGGPWHRRRTPEEREGYTRMKRERRAVTADKQEDAK